MTIPSTFPTDTPCTRSAQRGFTLIEVMIAVGIIAMLASMAMPMLNAAQRAAKKTATRSVMHKLDTALNLFRGDIGAYPYQRTYADISAGDLPTNRLAFHLGTTLAPGDVLKLHQDADSAAAQYGYDCSGAGSPVEAAPVSAHVFRTTDLMPPWNYLKVGGVWNWYAETKPNVQVDIAACVMLNRMAAERARLAIWSGNIDAVGCKIPDRLHPLGGVYRAGRDNSAIELLAAPAVKKTDATPGWAADYLAGELESRYLDGETVLDAWRRPIIYVCQVVEGVKGSGGILLHTQLKRIDSKPYGLGTLGRRTLAEVDPTTGAATVADGSYLPDPSRLMHSDRRRWAAPGLSNTFELWSSGPDQRFDWMRDHRENLDNVFLEPYDQDLN